MGELVEGCSGGPNATGAGFDEKRLGFFSVLFCFAFRGFFFFWGLLGLIENIFLNVFPGDEGLQEVPPMCRGPQVPPHK